MITLISRFYEIMLFRRGPQDLPASHSWLIALAIIDFGLNAWAEILYANNSPLLRTLLSFVTGVLLTYGLLRSKGLTSRIVQTYLALVGTDILMMLFLFPAMVLQVTGNATELTAIFILGLVLWSMFITAHIFRHALSSTMTVGFLIAVIWMAAYVFLVEMVFGTTT